MAQTKAQLVDYGTAVASSVPTNGPYLSAANTVAISTNGAQRVTVDSSGRCLVGTSTANNNLRIGESFAVVNTTADYGGACLTSYCGTSNPALAPVLDFQRSRGTSDGSFSAVGNGDTLGYLNFRGSTGSGFENFAAIYAQVDGAVSGTGDCPGRLVFSTTADGASSPAERLLLNSTGTASFYGLNDVVYGRSNRPAGTIYATFVGMRDATSTSTGTITFLVYTNGNVQNTNGSYTTISDVKLKENIIDANSQWDDLKAIKIRNWNFKAETGHETHRQIGPIAQELETVCPGLVFETPDRDEDGNETGEVTKGVNQSVLYMKAVKALQEAMERIEQLESEMAAVKAQLA